MFFSLTSDDQWVKRREIAQNHPHSHSVAISGKTAFVGLQFWGETNEGAVFVYIQDDFNSWGEVENPFIRSTNSSNDNFGAQVDIDGDLACVADSDNLYLFHRDSTNGKWEQFDMLEGKHGCTIDEDIIAVYYDYWSGFAVKREERIYHFYKYQRTDGVAVPIQDPIHDAYSFGLSGDYFAHSESCCSFSCVGGITIYHRGNETDNGAFAFHQHLEFSGYPMENSDIAIENGVMVFGGSRPDQMHVFTEENDGVWVEMLTLDGTYPNLHLSGRTLISYGSSEVNYFNLESCLPTPSQMPSMSMVPTASPSMTPSSSASPSVTPTMTVFPTETCYSIIITVSGDCSTISSGAYLESEIGAGSVPVWQVDDLCCGETHTETLCLPEGEYKFSVINVGEYYNVTTLKGELIGGGNEFNFFLHGDLQH